MKHGLIIGIILCLCSGCSQLSYNVRKTSYYTTDEMMAFNQEHIQPHLLALSKDGLGLPQLYDEMHKLEAMIEIKYGYKPKIEMLFQYKFNRREFLMDTHTYKQGPPIIHISIPAIMDLYFLKKTAGIEATPAWNYENYKNCLTVFLLHDYVHLAYGLTKMPLIGTEPWYIQETKAWWITCRDIYSLIKNHDSQAEAYGAEGYYQAWKKSEDMDEYKQKIIKLYNQ